MYLTLLCHCFANNQVELGPQLTMIDKENKRPNDRKGPCLSIEIKMTCLFPERMILLGRKTREDDDNHGNSRTHEKMTEIRTTGERRRTLLSEWSEKDE